MEKLAPDGVTKTRYTYEPNSGRLSTISRPNENGAATVTHRYFVDSRLRQEDYSDNSGSSGVADVTHTYETTGLGRLLTTTDSFLGDTIYTYRPLNADGGGAVETINGPLADDTLEFVYDWQGRVTTENLRSDANAVLRSETRTWDGLGRLATITNALGTFTHNYSATDISRLESLSRPNGLSTAFTYKANNAPGHSARALASITHKLSTTTLASHIYGYDPAGRITTWQQAGQGLTASTWSYGHNADDELLSATKSADSAPNTPIDSENWSLDAAGNWLSRSRGSGAVMETRNHNVMNRLTAIGGGGQTVVEGTVNEFASVTVNGAKAQLSKDDVGGGFRYRRTVPVAAGSNTVTVNATDQGGLTTTRRWQFNVPAASRSFSYDANGNTLSDGQRTMTWDVKNRLRSVTKGGATWKWDYDHQDRRVKEYENNTLTKIFIWSGTNVVQERDATGTITRTHYSGGFSDGSIAASGTKYQLLTDHLGHVREIVDASGTIVTRYDYSSYQGPVKVSGTVEATFQTIGRYYHHADSGLELALYRAYDPELGRWLNEDPIGERGGLNLYGYVGNSPVMKIDPKGEAFWIPFIIIGGLLLGADDANAPAPGDPITGGGPMKTVVACATVAGATAPFRAAPVLGGTGAAAGLNEVVAGYRIMSASTPYTAGGVYNASISSIHGVAGVSASGTPYGLGLANLRRSLAQRGTNGAAIRVCNFANKELPGKLMEAARSLGGTAQMVGNQLRILLPGGL